MGPQAPRFTAGPPLVLNLGANWPLKFGKTYNISVSQRHNTIALLDCYESLYKALLARSSSFMREKIGKQNPSVSGIKTYMRAEKA